ncbi:hypothetical protein J6590_055735 [Homalodisca vitripennis]|nr:hypothetical protein J6590_055735 [Homalodisca vitripennis]
MPDEALNSTRVRPLVFYQAYFKGINSASEPFKNKREDRHSSPDVANILFVRPLYQIPHKTRCPDLAGNGQEVIAPHLPSSLANDGIIEYSFECRCLYDSSTPNHSALHNTSIQELERSLEENGLHSNEGNLEMAAKIGAALVQEKRVLGDEKIKLLASVPSLEAKLEEAKETEEKFLNKTEKQLEKEKQHRLHLQAAFEEQDYKQL